MTKTTKNPCFLALLLAMPVIVLAAPAGEVEFAKGVGAAQAASGVPRILSQGVPIQPGDTVTMGSNSFAVLRLTDGTRMTLRPNTAIRFDEYAYKEPDKPDGFFTSLFKGGVRMVTGLIAKTSPTAARLTTPTATVGIRGTDFDARICGTDCATDAGRIAQPSGPANVAASARVAALLGPLSAVAPGGERRNVIEGGPVYPGEILETSSNGHAVLVFRDNTKVTVQPRTQFRVENFVYNRESPSDGSVIFNLLRGGMRVLTGLVGRSRPQAVRMTTPTATVGIRGTGVDIVSEPDSCAVPGGAAGCTMVATWDGEGVLNPGTANEFPVPTGVFAIQDSTTSAPRTLPTPPPVLINIPTPRPDTVPASAEQLFSANEINEADVGLFVFSRDGHLSLTSGDKSIDIARGETGFLNADGTQLVRAVVTPNFLEFDFIPRPDRLNPNAARLLDLAGAFRVRAQVCR
ncbi:MAG: FecR family protein [Burkholderiaceae bacterium]|nr:FecR domain-containing protein [Rhodoferax sp.]MCB2030526.1 FecR domain-containing protein [Rhodoferax sp.]MCP5260625.1 FecR domain-containing protein [Rhodoferax sp.]